MPTCLSKSTRRDMLFSKVMPDLTPQLIATIDEYVRAGAPPADAASAAGVSREVSRPYQVQASPRYRRGNGWKPLIGVLILVIGIWIFWHGLNLLAPVFYLSSPL